jgi:hypothetical protein
VMRFGAPTGARPSAASIARVQEFYRRDFEFFGYDLAPAD